jgi:exo-beta-1,3-glucanase (GH17 family)
MRLAIPLFALSAALIIAAWAWLGAPVGMPADIAGAGAKIHCVSYAPFRRGQSPLIATTRIEPFQIEEDLTQLARLTDCVRTYSVEFGLDRVPEIAGKYGLKVMQGLWLSGEPQKNRAEIEAVVALANKYPGVIRSVVVGNEVLLRGEMSAANLAATLREVKSRVPVPVTYADVWEFWMRNRTLAEVADFITIHILPYWEDFPIAAENAAAHVGSIRRHVVEAFPGKEVMIGEVGWPSAGRMREGALPSLVNQARVVQEVLSLSRRENFNANLIEAYDQSWKRALEGTVGGHWGLIDDTGRQFKFEWSAPVSNHTHWRSHAAGGVIFAAIIFVGGYIVRRRNDVAGWSAVAAIATVGGVAIGITLANIPLESLGVGGWARSLALGAAALLAPLLGAMMIMSDREVPAFWQVIGRLRLPEVDTLSAAAGFVLIVTTVLAIGTALGLTFDPRYKDFPYAPLAAASVPFLLTSVLRPRLVEPRAVAELAAAAVLTGCTGYIIFNEGFANWQSLLLCAGLLCLAVTLARVRGAPG